MRLPRLLIAGTDSGVGKTTTTLAVLAALRARGRQVQAFKIGPDFIDPGHHTAVTGRVSRNVDGWMLGQDVCRGIFAAAAADADVSIIEGMMGLYDGSDAVGERGSSAEMAKWLSAPVVLVIDASAMARSAAAMAHGYASFDHDVAVVGVIFSRVAGDGHFRIVKEAVETLTPLKVFGYLPAKAELAMPDRHLGLVTAAEQVRSEVYARLGRAAAETIDVDRLEAEACAAPDFSAQEPAPAQQSLGRSLTVGVAQDAAFTFYYADNLDLLRSAGARLVPFSPLSDGGIPDADVLYFGGGYPELYGEDLARNASMRRSVRTFAEAGGGILAECGGLMYLTQAIVGFEGASHEMVGLFPAETVMERRGMTIGYREVRTSRSSLLGPAGLTCRGHEFHYSRLHARGPLSYCADLYDARGEQRGADGLVFRNVLAFYTHLHWRSQPSLVGSILSGLSGIAPTSSPV